MCNLRKIKDILFLALLLGFVVFMTERCTNDKLPEPITISDTLSCDSLNVTYCKDTETIVTYCIDIKKIIEINCAIPGCHKSLTQPNTFGPFDTYDNIKNEALNGSLLCAIKWECPIEMPFLLPKLPDSIIAKIDCWIQAGAPNN